MDPVIFTLHENQLAASIVFIISFVGCVANCIVAIFTRRLPSMQNPFGRLLTSQSMGDAVFCSIFAFYYSPMVFYSNKMMETLAPRFGMVLLMCYDICILSHLFIALNRMCAICIPWQYEKYFSKNNTTIFIVISWVVAITRCSVCYGLRDCDLAFMNSIWAFMFTETKECIFISSYLDFYKDSTLVGIIAFLDIVTLIKVRMTSAELRKAGLSETGKRRRKEINFLKQAVLQGIVFLVELFTYFHLAWKFDNKWIIWSLTTVAWTLVHCTDALIIIGFNEEFRKLISSPKYALKSLVSEHHSTAVERITTSDKQ